MKTKSNFFPIAVLSLLMVSKSFAAGWENFSNISSTTDALVVNNTLWITAKGGIIKIDQTTGQKTFIHKGEAGLLSSSVEKVLTNALTGDTWIGTYDNGLARWNGTSFESYPFPQNMFLTNMRFDHFGKIWMESDLGLFRFDPANGSYTKINDAPTNTWTYNAWGYDFLSASKVAVFNGSTSVITDIVTGAVIDSFQNPIDTTTLGPGEFGLNIIFQGCSPNAVSLFTIDSNTCLLQNANLIVVHPKNGILRKATIGMQAGENAGNIIRNEAGELILFSDLSNLYKWNGNGWDFIMTVPLQSQASRLLCVHNGNYYFNTGAEVLVYMLSSSGSNTIDARQYPFASNHIRAVAEKPTGGVIIASANQLLNYEESTRNFSPYLTIPSKYNMAGSIKFLNGNMYYIDYGNMMYKYDGVKFDSVPKLLNGLSNDVYDYDVMPNGTIWIVNGDGLLKYDGTTTTKIMGNITNRYFLSLKYDDQRRTLWIGTNKGVIQYDVDFGTSVMIDHTVVPQMLGAEAIQTITADKNNTIWFGANNSRVMFYDGTQYTVIGLPNAQTNDFVVDIDFNQDTVYFNMTGGNGGVYKYFNGNFQFLHPTTVPQLLSAQNDAILIDKSGSLWIAHADAGVSVNRSGTATGIGNVELSGLSFYPNPTNSIVTITGNFERNAAYQVTDMHGKLYGKALLANHQIDVSNLDAGIYFIAIKDSQHTYTGRLIKQ
jgi:hypothetical protein